LRFTKKTKQKTRTRIVRVHKVARKKAHRARGSPACGGVMATIGKVSREDFRKQKELDEARKAGTAPAEVDEEGR
jgi:hypothetical protein